MVSVNDVYTFHEDPGHGWLEVPRAALVELGIAHRITGYSHQAGQVVYLEEDCDAGTFVRAWEVYVGQPWSHVANSVTRHTNGDSGIRGCAQYKHGK